MTNPVLDILTGQEPTVKWIIPDLLPQSTIVQYAGDPGVGKSFFAYQLTMAVATQSPFLGFRCQHTLPTLYCDVENSKPDRDEYLRWAWKGLGQPNLHTIADNFWVSHFELSGHDWADMLLKLVIKYQPGLVVCDTATPAFAIQNENDNSETSRTIKKLRYIQQQGELKPTFLILRHAKTFMEQDQGRKARGAQAWKGETDATWFHVRKTGRPRKDGLKNTFIEPDKVRAFGLRETIHIEPIEISERGKRSGIQLTRGKVDG